MRTQIKKVNEPREAAVSGSFYSSDAKELSADIKEALHEAKEFPKQNINALIVPHAGYVYSGDVAATAYKTLYKKYKNVFLIGSSHHVNFDGVSIYNGNYKTPLGEVSTNTDIIQTLLAQNDFITCKLEAHEKEHTLEMQLPFLQTIYADDLRIVPIIVATSELQTIQKLAQTLRPYFNDENLFIISTDLSHYPKYEDANKVDKEFLDALSTNSTQALIDAIIKSEESKIPELHTSACGWSSLLTLLYMTQNKDFKYELLEYKNSGDKSFGDKNRVVGYSAMRIFKQENGFSLTQEEKQELKSIAKQALTQALEKETRLQLDKSKISQKFKEPLGAFVTLNLENQLKGCIGRFEPDEPLYEVIIDMAIAASRYDNRFVPLKLNELKNTEIELSILTPRVKVNSSDDIILGKHGIYVRYGSKNGTYLPHVATEMNFSKEEFFQSCCQDKAQIDAKNCKDAELYVYEAIVF